MGASVRNDRGFRGSNSSVYTVRQRPVGHTLHHPTIGGMVSSTSLEWFWMWCFRTPSLTLTLLRVFWRKSITRCTLCISMYCQIKNCPIALCWFEPKKKHNTKTCFFYDPDIVPVNRPVHHHGAPLRSIECRRRAWKIIPKRTTDFPMCRTIHAVGQLNRFQNGPFLDLKRHELANSSNSPRNLLVGGLNPSEKY